MDLEKIFSIGQSQARTAYGSQDNVVQAE